MSRPWKPWMKRTAWIVGILGGLLAVAIAGVVYVWMELYYPGRIYGRRWPQSYWRMVNKSSLPIWLEKVSFNGRETMTVNRVIYGKDPPKIDFVTRLSSFELYFTNNEAPFVKVSVHYRIGYQSYTDSFVIPNVSYSCYIELTLTDDGMTADRCWNRSPIYDD